MTYFDAAPDLRGGKLYTDQQSLFRLTQELLRHLAESSEHSGNWLSSAWSLPCSLDRTGLNTKDKWQIPVLGCHEMLCQHCVISSPVSDLWKFDFFYQIHPDPTNTNTTNNSNTILPFLHRHSPYRVVQKISRNLLSTSLPNIDRFSDFFTVTFCGDWH